MVLDIRLSVSMWKHRRRFGWCRGREVGLIFECGCPTAAEVRTASAAVQMNVVDQWLVGWMVYP